MLLFDIISPIN